MENATLIATLLCGISLGLTPVGLLIVWSLCQMASRTDEILGYDEH